MAYKASVEFYINGKLYSASGEQAFLTVAEFLRYEAGLTGTKIVCAEGDCGACTVLMAQDSGDFQSVNSCILPIYQLDGSQIVTVEGVGSAEKLHPTQTAMVECHGSQCGYCTPGFICSMTSLFDESKKTGKEITEKRASNYLTGNLCRCTGYEPILKAAVSLNGELSNAPSTADKYSTFAILQKCKEIDSKSLLITHNGREVFLPVSWDLALEYKYKYPDAKIVNGATDLLVFENKGKYQPQRLISLKKIPELSKITESSNTIEIFSLATLTEIKNFLEGKVESLANLLHVFASPQIKNRGTLIGNIVNGSPIGDLIPAMMALGAELNLISSTGSLWLPLDQLYRGYRDLAINPDEIVRSIRFHKPNFHQHLKTYKVSLRKDLDISAVTMAALLTLDKNIIKDAVIVLGGVGPTVKRYVELEQFVQGKTLAEGTFTQLGDRALNVVQPISDLRGSQEYRKMLVKNLFKKMYRELEGNV